MGHPVLRIKTAVASRTDIATAEVQRLIDDMIDTMLEYNGVGLAAPQVHQSVRLFVAHIPPNEDEDDDEADRADRRAHVITVINPEISAVSRHVEEEWEGCLSIPDLRGQVPRYRDILVKGLNRHGERLEIKAGGFAARILQHESDHLDGVLFLDRMKTLRNLSFIDEYARYHVKRDDE